MRSLTLAALAASAAVCGAGAQAAVLYRFTSPAYDSVTNFQPPCGGGNCVTLPMGGRVQAQFTTASPLPPGLNWGGGADIVPLLTHWQFSNGSIMLTQATPGVRMHHFFVATDAAGRITETRILLSRWMDGGSGPHAVGDRVAYISANTGGTHENYTVLNAPCGTLGASHMGVSDTCIGFLEPPGERSRAAYPSGGTWVMDAPLASIGNASIIEGDSGTGQMVFTVSLSKAPLAPARLNWRTVNGTAKAPQDYGAASGTLAWAVGRSASQTITVPIHGDTGAEPDETFTVVLDGFVGMAGGASAAGASVFGPHRIDAMAGGASTFGTGTILNDDMPPPPPPPPAGATPVPALTVMGAGALSALLLAAKAAGRRRARKDDNPPKETP